MNVDEGYLGLSISRSFDAYLFGINLCIELFQLLVIPDQVRDPLLRLVRRHIQLFGQHAGKTFCIKVSNR